MTRQDCMLPCFKCGSPVERVFEYELQPSDATTFTTYGHYGSTFWDDFVGEEIAIIICDSCLREHTDRIARHKRFRKIVVEYPPMGDRGIVSHGIVGREWLDHEPVPYFEGEHNDTEDQIVIEPEEVGVLAGDRIEWVGNWQRTKESVLECWADYDKENP